MGTQLSNAPIVCAVAQIRHNPTPNFEKHTDALLESLQKVGLPGLTKGKHFAIRMPHISLEHAASPINLAAPVVDEYERLVLTDTPEQNAVIIDSGSFSYVTTNYQTFEIFLENFARYLEKFEQIIEPKHVERIGVRYVDAFEPIVSNPSEDNLDPLKRSVVNGVLGIVEHLRDQTVASTSSETHFMTTEEEHVVTRTLIQVDRFTLPFGLEMHPLKIKQRFLDIAGLFVTIDTDSYKEARVLYDRESILKRIDSLHKGASVAFKATVTTDAIDYWNKK